MVSHSGVRGAGQIEVQDPLPGFPLVLGAIIHSAFSLAAREEVSLPGEL